MMASSGMNMKMKMKTKTKTKMQMKAGVPIMLRDLMEPSSPFFKHAQSLRLTGKLETYQAENGIAEISDEGVTFKINTRYLNLTQLPFYVGSFYQFIGELVIGLDPNHVLLQARVVRSVDGLDLNMYHQSLLVYRNLESNLLTPKNTSH